MPNRLAASSSPYLLQHKDNPVDWWEWSDEAFAEAVRRDVPVFLSIGYSSCHWCHVMAHESFENPELARALNEGFVPVKVDRQERPDVDAVYMSAVQAMTGHGGWPMSTFLDHQRRPFFAGTYYPPTPRHGSPGFGDVLAAVSDAWRTRRGEVEETGDRIAAALRDRTRRAGQFDFDEALLTAAVDDLGRQYDTARGGFGAAPKFPPTSVIEFLLRRSALDGDDFALRMAAATCEAMARGGMYDQLAGGFARYSVDADWVVPHFEKMLYDNALLLRNYAHLTTVSGSQLGRRVAVETAEFLLRELRTPEGAFAASFDADSEGHEGRYYVWTPSELRDALGDDADWVATLCGVTASGTFEQGSSVLQLRRDPDDAERWRHCRERLLQVRQLRVSPERDDSVIAAWNGLAVSALTRAGALLDQPSFVSAAAAALDHVLATHRSDKGLVRVSLAGEAGVAPAVLEDYAALALAALDLYAVSGDERWYRDAEALLAEMLARFVDEAGRLRDTSRDHSDLYLDLTDASDNASPSGLSLAADALDTFATLSSKWLDEAARAAGEVAAVAGTHPRFAGWALAVGATRVGGSGGIAVTGDDAVGSELHQVALRSLVAGFAIGVGDPQHSAVPLVAERAPDTRAAAYLCRDYVCSLPVYSGGDLRVLLAPGPAE